MNNDQGVALRPEDLRIFTGTETWTRHGLNRNMLYTDGVKAFADRAGGGAYWFLDIMATEVFALQLAQPFIYVKMTVTGDRCARIVAEDGNGGHLWSRAIEFTDCPEGVWEFYLIDHVLLLPSEY